MEQVARLYLWIPQVPILSMQSLTDFVPFFQPSCERCLRISSRLHLACVVTCRTPSYATCVRALINAVIYEVHTVEAKHNQLGKDCMPVKRILTESVIHTSFKLFYLFVLCISTVTVMSVLMLSPTSTITRLVFYLSNPSSAPHAVSHILDSQKTDSALSCLSSCVWCQHVRPTVTTPHP
jgi:hypothetical protein